MTRVAAAAVDPKGNLTAEQFLVMSTGVIGRFLRWKRSKRVFKPPRPKWPLQNRGSNACDGILTTDIARKIAERRFVLGGRERTLSECARVPHDWPKNGNHVGHYYYRCST